MDLAAVVIIMRTSKQRHLEEDTVERYAMNSLPEDAAGEVEQHLLICEPCRDRVSEADGFARAMKGASQLLPAEPERSRWSFRFPIAAFAFSAALIALLAVFLIPRGGDRSPATVQLFAMRGTSVEARGPSRRPLLLQPDLNGLPAAPSYRIELVNASGAPVWHGTLDVKALPPTSQVPSQPRGAYFVRVSLPSGELLREFALELRGTD